MGNLGVIDFFTLGIDLQDDAVGVDALVDEHAGQRGEVVGVLGGEVLAGAAAAAVALDFGMPLQVISQAVGNDGPLLDDVEPLRLVAVDFIDEQGIVGASQDYRVDIGALVHEQVDVFLDKIVGAVVAALAVLDQRYPHGAGMAMDFEIGVHPFDFNVIAAAGNGARSAEHADVAGARL